VESEKDLPPYTPPSISLTGDSKIRTTKNGNCSSLAVDLAGLFRNGVSKDQLVEYSCPILYLGIRTVRDAGNNQSDQLVRYHCHGTSNALAMNDYSSNEFELWLALLLRAYLLGLS